MGNDQSKGRLACSGALLFALLGCSGEPAATEPEVMSDYVHVESGRVVDASGGALWLRGVQMGGWEGSGDPRLDQHDERDYERVAAMGMNVVRLILDFPMLENEGAPLGVSEYALSWIDDNVAWAKNHNVYLVLSIWGHPGGSETCGHPFWDDTALQDRFAAVWSVLAERYAQEKGIAGYALVELPEPTQSLEQWEAIAGRLTSVVRAVDPHHMLFVGRAHSIGQSGDAGEDGGVVCAYDLPGAQTFPNLTDDNVLYEFDRQQPWDYVAQLTTQYDVVWTGGPYPNDMHIDVSLAGGCEGTGRATWRHASWDGRPSAESLYLKPDETKWTDKSFSYTVTDERFRFATPTLQSDFNKGTVYFDDIVINEYDQEGNFVREILDLDLEEDGSLYLWEGDSSGCEIDGAGVKGVANEGHRGDASVTITGTDTLANLSNQSLAFLVQLGHTYEVTAWMKGENSSADGLSMVRLDFWDYEGDIGAFDKASLETLFDDFSAWGRSKGVPLNVSTYGTGRPTFDQDLGGLEYVNDFIDIMLERELHFTYYMYHSPDFGIYGNDSGLPDEDFVNQPLVDLLTAKHR